VRVRVPLVVSVCLATFLVSALAAAQFRSQPLPPSNRVARNEALRTSVNDLEAENRHLRDRVGSLQAAIRLLEDQSAQRSSAAQRLTDMVASQKVAVGLVPLHGPGLTISLHDGRNPNDPADRSLGWIVHYQDIQDIVSLLWATGAEAITINQQRVVPTTSFFYAGVNILVNNANRLSSPYLITALGDPPSLIAGLNDPNQLTELKSRSRNYDLGLSWRRGSRLTSPAYDATFVLKNAQPIS
jgi:uncharacterized protein YlxW (UPF0749 family)